MEFKIVERYYGHNFAKQNNFLKRFGNIKITDRKLSHQQLHVQIEQWKHQNKVLNLFKVNNKDTRTKPLAFGIFDSIRHHSISNAL